MKLKQRNYYIIGSATLFLLLFGSLVMISAEPNNRFIGTETPTEFIDRYHFKDYTGNYQFISDETVLLDTSLNPLRILKFGRDEGGEWSHCIVIASIGEDGTLTELYKSKTTPDGVTPEFQGLDVLGPLGGEGSVLVIKWRIQGNGGMRLVQSLKYTEGKINYIGGTMLYYQRISEEVSVPTWTLEKP